MYLDDCMYYDIFIMITRSFGCSPNLSVEMLGFWTTGGRPMVDRCPVDIYCQWFGRENLPTWHCFRNLRVGEI